MIILTVTVSDYSQYATELPCLIMDFYSSNLQKACIWGRSFPQFTREEHTFNLESHRQSKQT